jgi:hypothetical protein
MYQSNNNLDPDQVIDLVQVAYGASLAEEITGKHVIVVQNNGSQPVYLGNDSVTAGGGYKLIAGADFQLTTSRKHLFCAANSSGATNITTLLVFE